MRLKEHALLLVASGMGRKAAATAVGTTTESVRQWVLKAEAAGTMPTPPRAPSVIAPLSLEQLTGEATGGPPESKDAGSLYAPKDPGQGLSKMETDEILKLKKKHPSYQPAQLRAQLKRFKGWRLSIKAIARVLRRNGYELVHRGSRPEGPDPIRFEAPRRNAIWQLDYMELRVPDERFHLLVVVDDFSRFCVGYAVTDSPTAETAVRLLERVIARHGKPETVRTDRGGGFLSGDFTDYLEAELIDHIVGRPYHPQGGGMVSRPPTASSAELIACSTPSTPCRVSGMARGLRPSACSPRSTPATAPVVRSKSSAS
jgi:transposase